MQTLLYFYLYSFLGWAAECIYCGIPAKKFINRGFLAGPYCPVYGFGAMIVVYLLTPFADSLLLVFLMGVLTTSGLEYITSVLMEKLFHTKWWDYSKKACNLHGRICLKNSLLFGLMAVIVFYGIQPAIAYVLTMMNMHQQEIVVVLISLIFGYDVITTTHALLRKNIDFKEIERSIHELREDFKTANIFPLTQPLSDKVQAILNKSDADEKLMVHIEKLKGLFDNFHLKQKSTHERLKKAFPSSIEALSRMNAEHLFEIIRKDKENRK